MYTASIYFMGQYCPAYFEGESAFEAVGKAIDALDHCDTAAAEWFTTRLLEAREKLSGNCTAYSADHGCRGVALRTGPHDPFLDSITRSFPNYPDLDYSEVANA